LRPPFSPAIGQSFKEEAPFEEGNLTLETGKLARLADAAVVVGFQETKVLCTAIASRFMEPGQSFLPLTVSAQIVL
jgi:polyribonucleotide nucleotidyltransferase